MTAKSVEYCSSTLRRGTLCKFKVPDHGGFDVEVVGIVINACRIDSKIEIDLAVCKPPPSGYSHLLNTYWRLDSSEVTVLE